jgi:hypothetical protein
MLFSPVPVSHVLSFISICEPFTGSPSHILLVLPKIFTDDSEEYAASIIRTKEYSKERTKKKVNSKKSHYC